MVIHEEEQVPASIFHCQTLGSHIVIFGTLSAHVQRNARPYFGDYTFVAPIVMIFRSEFLLDYVNLPNSWLPITSRRKYI